MKSLAVDPKAKTHEQLTERCIGCGLCAVACDRRHAINMEPVPDYRLPPGSWFALLSRSVPKMLHNSWDAWRARRRSLAHSG